MSSPTYGTDKTANSQLASDVGRHFLVQGQEEGRDRIRPTAGAGEAGERRRDAAGAAGERGHRVQPELARIA